jgi:hypothetical protein
MCPLLVVWCDIIDISLRVNLSLTLYLHDAYQVYNVLK